MSINIFSRMITVSEFEKKVYEKEKIVITVHAPSHALIPDYCFISINKKTDIQDEFKGRLQALKIEYDCTYTIGRTMYTFKYDSK